MLRRLLVAAVVLAVCLPSAVTAKERARRVVRPYASNPQRTVAFHTASCSDGEVLTSGSVGIGGPANDPRVRFGTLRGERTATIEIADQMPGQTIIAIVQTAGRRMVICGETTRRIKTRAGYAVGITLLTGLSDEGPSLVTSGVVRATFYR